MSVCDECVHFGARPVTAIGQLTKKLSNPNRTVPNLHVPGYTGLGTHVFAHTLT